MSLTEYEYKNLERIETDEELSAAMNSTALKVCTPAKSYAKTPQGKAKAMIKESEGDMKSTDSKGFFIFDVAIETENVSKRVLSGGRAEEAEAPSCATFSSGTVYVNKKKSPAVS
jgi:hypothetical protein